MNFLTVLLAIIILEGYGELAFIQRDEWVRKWHQGLARLSFLARSSNLKIAAFILIPAVVLHLVLAALAQNQLGFFVFVSELVVLLYAMGRGNLDTQISLLSSDLERKDLQAAFYAATLFNTGYREGNASSSDDLRDEVFAALPYRIFERSFAVVFWFFFLGAPVALCYRLLALYGDLDLENSAADIEEELDNQSLADKLLWLLEWIPVRLLGFTIGLVGSFSHTMAHLRELIFCSDTGAAELLRRCVNGALGESASNNVEDAALSKATINAVASLFRRAMTAWLVGIAILVILS
jgi:AmpE protein